MQPEGVKMARKGRATKVVFVSPDVHRALKKIATDNDKPIGDVIASMITRCFSWVKIEGEKSEDT
jgi:hypothetical protein